MFSIIAILIALFLIILFILNIMCTLLPCYLIIKTIINKRENLFKNKFLSNFNEMKTKGIILFIAYLMSKIVLYCIPSIININKEIIISENYLLTTSIITFYLVMFYLSLKNKYKLK